MVSGNARIEAKRSRIEINAGDLFYIPKHCKYESFWYGNPEIDFLSFGFSVFPGDGSIEMPLQTIQADEETRRLMRKIRIGSPTDCESLGRFMIFFGRLLKFMKTERCGSQYINVKSAMGIMRRDNYLSLAKVAEACGISPSTLYADFKAVTNGTPAIARQKIRAEIAADLLTTTDLTIEAISDKAGFSSSSYMRKILQKHYGLTPGQIRKKFAL